MRILHTSDWHLGRTLHGVDLTESHAAYFDSLVETCRSEQVDAVLVSGDIYDRAVPPVESVKLLDEVLARLSEFTSVVLTPGNHDSATRLGFGAHAFSNRLQVISKPSATPVLLGGQRDQLLVYALPYLDPNTAPANLRSWANDDYEIARSHQAVLDFVLRRVEADLASRRAASSERIASVLMAHTFVTGAKPSDSERDLRIGGVDSVSASSFSPELDYVALGHLHGQQKVGSADELAQIRYSGSPVAFSFSEKDHQKLSLLVDFEDGRLTAQEKVPAPVLRKLSDAQGSLSELASPRFDSQRDDWVRVTVAEERRPEQLVQQVKRLFPHMLTTEFHSTAEAQETITVRGVALSPLEMTSSFIEYTTNTLPSEAELTVLREAIQTVTSRGK